MSKNLVIVESPAKAKTLKKYLGKDFEVLASYGHVRDLIPKKGAVDPESRFKMHYQLIEKNAKRVTAITQALNTSEALYLATDPDREGEAIAWHVYEILKRKKAMKGKPVHRIIFHEITQKAIEQAVKNPKTLKLELIHAQQARRALDYLVGFTLSPLLWKKIRRGLSAGRVQSPALKLIVERELEIECFKSQEYWTLTAQAQTGQQAFQPKLIVYQDKKLLQFSIQSEKEANAIKTDLLLAAKGSLIVEKVEKKDRKRQPAAPFTTATLQQEAAHQLGFTAQQTMRTAQQLYEGIDLGEGPSGLITYMRTDSVNLAEEALQAIRTWIQDHYNSEALPDTPRHFRTKSKNAQEAHEAIRPTEIGLVPTSIQTQLNLEQFKLYQLIWKRTLASQMIHASLKLLSITLSGGEGNHYRISGTTVINPGFMAVYQETPDSPSFSEEEGLSQRVTLQGVTPQEATPQQATPQGGAQQGDAPPLPILAVGDSVKLLDILSHQHFTEPPPRYGEASLIKTLEAHGIGRPSTYVPIITTLKQREYVILDQKRFKPTDVGRVVNRFLSNYFNQYVDYDFTAQLEDELDSIARGEILWIPVLKKFWNPFKNQVEHTEATVQRKEVTQEVLEERCPQCRQPLSNRLGKRGRFIGCSAYPECNYTRDLNGEVTSEPIKVPEGACPICGQALYIRQGRYGKFIGCSQYPKCKHLEPLEKPADTGIPCPECQQGSLLQRKSRRAKVFYSCSTYPSCQYAVWNEPIPSSCPKCAWPIVTIKVTKRRGTEHVCPRKTCAHSVKVG